GAGEEDRKQAKNFNTGMFNIVFHSADTEQLKTSLADYLEQILKNIPDTEKTKAIYDDNFITSTVERVASPWMQYFIKYDPAPALEKVKCPVLALNGEKDMQVPAKVNLEAIKAALEKGGNRNVTIKEIPGLNHLFQECKTCLITEYASIEQTFSPVALDEILKWIKMQTKP
ncbi:MAG: alpha/beta hydrolase, partial [Tannerella sp.]|nr:alpha/beta hydrolase [Tannerella sp.]